jgi:hypothetical protein
MVFDNIFSSFLIEILKIPSVIMHLFIINIGAWSSHRICRVDGWVWFRGKQNSAG